MHEAIVFQDLNVHYLMLDFEQELPGYHGNGRIAAVLAALTIEPGEGCLYDKSHRWYAALVEGALSQAR